MLSSANEILSVATIEQRKWVLARLQLKSDAAAARAIGIHPTSIYRWPNKKDLDRAVELLLEDAVEAARAILRDAAPDAARTLERNLLGKHAVQAANSILDRVGVIEEKRIKIEDESEHVIVIRNEAKD